VDLIVNTALIFYFVVYAIKDIIQLNKEDVRNVHLLASSVTAQLTTVHSAQYKSIWMLILGNVFFVNH
jgi:hypothetical protein